MIYFYVSNDVQNDRFLIHLTDGGTLIMPKTSLKTIAYNEIRKKLVTCEYAPGSFLNEEMLTTALGLGRTPVRDALSRLEHEGLVEIRPKIGITVTPLNISDINKIFEVRLLLEPYIIRNYGSRIPSDQLNRYYQIFVKPPMEGYQSDGGTRAFNLDADFHSLIIDACPNEYIRGLFTQIRTQNARFRHMTGSMYDSRLEDTFREHLEIVRACLEQNWEGAAEKLHAHIMASKQATFSLAFEKLGTLGIS